MSKMKCTVRVWGNDEELLVGVVYWRDGYISFATFPWNKDPRIYNSSILEPDLVGALMEIEFDGVTTDLQASNPTWLKDLDREEDGKDEDVIYYDLSIYEAWLKKKKIDIPEPIDPLFFKKKLKSEKSKSIYKKSQQILTIL